MSSTSVKPASLASFTTVRFVYAVVLTVAVPIDDAQQVAGGSFSGRRRGLRVGQRFYE